MVCERGTRPFPSKMVYSRISPQRPPWEQKKVAHLGKKVAVHGTGGEVDVIGR